MSNRSLQQRLSLACEVVAACVLLVSCDEAPTQPTPPPPPPGPTVTRSTGPLAFVSNRDGTEAIYVADEDGSNVTRLTTTSVNSYPAWSPDRRSLAFVRQPEVFVVNVDGSGLRRIWSQGRTWGPIDWSPDGSKIVFATFGSLDTGIFVMNRDGSELTRLIDHESAGPGCGGGDYCGVLSPTWSPDGQQIAFDSWGGYGGFGSLVITSVDGTQRRSLSASGYSPAWSPDGTKITFHTGDGRIGLVSADGAGRPLFLQVSGEDPRWAPDGSILYSALNVAGRRRVFITTETGSPRQLIPEATAATNPGYYDCCAAWAR
jgi:Tol biopolymer transport system component